MAALATYYYSSASFSTAVALYTDAALSIFAPDGWYSDESIFRQQASGLLYAEGTCPSCGTPAPVPTPVTYDYRIYDECAGSGTQVFRVPSGGSWPATVLYSSVCYGNPQATGSTSTVNVSGLPSYANCSACGTPPTPTPIPIPTPGPSPVPVPVPVPIPTPTPVPAITYDYNEYTECGGSTTQVFRGVSGYAFPSFLGYSGNCWENPLATVSTSLVDAAGLTTYANCVACTPTPIPIPIPIPVPTATGTELFSTNSVGNGEGSSGAACPLQTSHSIYTSRANVASVVATDILYTNVTLTNVWNGALDWYGITDVTAKYPDIDSGFAFLVNSSGVVDAVVDCTPAPSPPSPSPTPTTQYVEIRECGTTTPTYKIRISGTYGYIVNQALKITGAALGPNPEFTGTDCWEIIDNAASTYASTVTVNSADSSCGGCTGAPPYDYGEYTECFTSTTQIFRKLTTTVSWPAVVKYNVGGYDLCFSNQQSTTGTSTVSVESLTPNYPNCFDCETPTTYVNATAGNGWVESTACNYATSDYIFTSRANVGLIQTGDTMYANSSLSTIFNGALDWYGVSNVLGQVTPDYKLLINSLGVVDAVVSCAAPTPTPTPTPVPVATQEISIIPCGGGSTYHVQVTGASGLVIGLGIKLSSGGGGSCPAFDSTQCYEITAVNIGYHNCSGVFDVASSNCGGLSGCGAPTPTPVPTPVPVPTPPTPTPTPTPVPTTSNYYYTVTRCDGGVDAYTEIVSTIVLSTGEAVFMADNNCYEIQALPAGINSNSYVANYTDCSACIAASPTPTPVAPTPTPTPTPTPAPTPTPVPAAGCYAITGAQGVSFAAACSSSRTEDLYFDSSNFCTATVYYGNIAGCTTIYSSSTYISVGGNQRLWSGSAFTYFCTSC